MIKWCDGQRVKVKTSKLFESVVMIWNRQASNTKQIELIDSVGSLLYTTKEMVTILIPKGLDPKKMHELIMIGKEDMYVQEIKKEKIEIEEYKEKKYWRTKRKEDANKRK